MGLTWDLYRDKATQWVHLQNKALSNGHLDEADLGKGSETRVTEIVRKGGGGFTSFPLLFYVSF